MGQDVVLKAHIFAGGKILSIIIYFRQLNVYVHEQDTKSYKKWYEQTNKRKNLKSIGSHSFCHILSTSVVFVNFIYNES